MNKLNKIKKITAETLKIEERKINRRFRIYKLGKMLDMEKSIMEEGIRKQEFLTIVPNGNGGS